MVPRRLGLGHLAAGFLICLAAPAAAVQFAQVNLVTDDQSAHPAKITDPALVNGWGIAYSPTSPFWVSAADGMASSVYSVNPTTQVTARTRTVTIAGNPTGQVFNSSSASGAFNGDTFLFVSEDGAVLGWRNPLGTVAETLVTAQPANSYKGAAFATVGGNAYLYAANFKASTIDVYKGLSGAPDLASHFTDPALPAGYAPFNVQNLGNTLYVAYAFKTDPGDDEETAGPGLGLVDAFGTDGSFIGRITTGGMLNAPWGLAIAPSSFGPWAGALLVGNFGNGRINAFDATTHAFLGQVTGSGGTPLRIDGLWAITPGNGASGGSSALLYFTAGPDGEGHGLFGVLTAVPEPAPAALLLAGLGIVGGGVAARRRPRA